MNLGRLHTQGIELELHGAISKQLLLSGNFSYLKGNQMGSYEAIDTVKSKGNHVQMQTGGGFVDAGDVTLKGLARRPIMANISLTYYPVKKVFCKAILKYVSKRNDVFYDYSLGPYGALGLTSVNAYTLVDLISGVKFDANLSALVRVENVFNVSYSEIMGYASRGRGIYLTVNYTF
jgi:outer membrane receptor protein involved in Fe transport